MQDTLRLTSPALDIKAWTMLEYIQGGMRGRLDIFLRWNDDWVCFDNRRHDCEDYLDLTINTVNTMIEGEL